MFLFDCLFSSSLRMIKRRWTGIEIRASVAAKKIILKLLNFILVGVLNWNY